MVIPAPVARSVPFIIAAQIKTKLIGIAVFSLVCTIGGVIAADPAPSLNAESALARLKEGNARFTSSKVSESKPTAARRRETAQSQRPFAIILGCADSRTAPEIIFDQNIGDIFVVRNAGNLVDDHVLGSIEYAVEHLGARLIVVLGHEKCGAVSAALAGNTAPAHVQSIVRDIQPAVQAVKGKSGDVTKLAVAENARLMAGRIRAEAQLGELAKQVRVTSAVYDIGSGTVDWAKE